MKPSVKSLVLLLPAAALTFVACGTKVMVQPQPSNVVATAPAAPAPVVVQTVPVTPAPPVETMSTSPGSDYVWVAGYYDWRVDHYVWVPGAWMRTPRAVATWVPGHWQPTTGGYIWVEGQWR